MVTDIIFVYHLYRSKWLIVIYIMLKNHLHWGGGAGKYPCCLVFLKFTDDMHTRYSLTPIQNMLTQVISNQPNAYIL